jgi:hypothetical protein
VSYLYLLAIPAVALLVLALWYGAIVGWALVLRRMASSIRSWDELERDETRG